MDSGDHFWHISPDQSGRVHLCCGWFHCKFESGCSAETTSHNHVKSIPSEIKVKPTLKEQLRNIFLKNLTYFRCPSILIASQHTRGVDNVMFTHFGSVVLYCFVIIIGPKHSTNYDMELYKHLTLGFLIAIFIPCTVLCTSSELRRGFKRFLGRLWAFCQTPSDLEVEAEVAIISISAFIDGKAAGSRNRYQKSVDVGQLTN